GWTLAAAEGICAGDGLESEEIFGLLADLVDKSLVVAEPVGDEAHYRLLETLRQYGSEKLRDAGEEQSLRTHHLEWFATLFDDLEMRMHDFEQVARLAEVEREYDNVRAALAWSQVAPDGAAAGIRLAAGVWPYWFVCGLAGEGRRWLHQA